MAQLTSRLHALRLQRFDSAVSMATAALRTRRHSSVCVNRHRRMIRSAM